MLRQPELYSFLDLKINTGKGYAELSFSGSVTRSMLDDSFIQLLEHPDFKYNINACYDYSNAYPEMEMAEIEEHAQLVSKYFLKRGPSYKLALIANDTLNNALLAVYKLLISKTSVEAEVFSQKSRAIRWLENED